MDRFRSIHTIDRGQGPVDEVVEHRPDPDESDLRNQLVQLRTAQQPPRVLAPEQARDRTAQLEHDIPGVALVEEHLTPRLQEVVDDLEQSPRSCPCPGDPFATTKSNCLPCNVSGERRNGEKLHVFRKSFGALAVGAEAHRRERVFAARHAKELPGEQAVSTAQLEDGLTGHEVDAMPEASAPSTAAGLRRSDRASAGTRRGSARAARGSRSLRRRGRSWHHPSIQLFSRSCQASMISTKMSLRERVMVHSG